MFDSAKKIKNIILISILTLTSLFICFQNFSSNTYLSGWDTLHSEFDFSIAFKRALSPAFQDHQGIGAVSSQSHVGDLPRILFLYLLSFFLSENFLRYSYVFLMLIIGPLGVYYFLKELLGKNNIEKDDDSMLFPSFVGAFFYLTNLSVVQHFNIPLEMFLTLYGFLGFIFLYSYRILHDLNKNNLRNLIIVSFLISPSGHTATLFYMFILIMFTYLFVNYLFSEDKKTCFLNSVIALSVIVGVNLFWILPNIYFIFSHGREVSDSKIHSLFSDQAYLSNLAFGNIYDIALLKNYLFIWQIWDGKKFVDLLQGWLDNLSSGINLFGYFVFFLSIFGIGASFVKKEKKFYGFFAIFFLSFIFIASSNSVLGSLIDFIRLNVPFMKEALRFPFNKFSTIFSFSLAIFLGYFTLFLFSIVKQEILKIFTVIFFSIFSIVFFLPAFRGDLINPLMRINFNKDYFEVFEYFNSQKEFGRVSDLPIHSVYGWSYYNFGYQGAGFLWFGIDKPIFNREFDRWNVKNEDYFNEMSFAIYNNDSEGIERVLNKYQIKWILLDKNIFSPNDLPSVLHFDDIEKNLTNIKNLKVDKKIGENIYIYKYSPQVSFDRSQIVENVNYLSNEFYRENVDLPYLKIGNYFTDNSKVVSFGMKTPSEILNKNNISSDDENFYIKNIKNLSKNELLINLKFQNSFFELNHLERKERFSVPINTSFLRIDGELLNNNSERQVILNSNSKIYFLKNVQNYNLRDIDKFVSFGNCGNEVFGSKYSLDRGDDKYSLSSENITSCLKIDLTELFKGKNINNYVLQLKVGNTNSNSYYCAKSSQSSNCSKIKLQRENSIFLNANEANILLFNEPNANLSAISEFSNINISLVQEIGTQEISINNNLFAKTEEIALKKNPNLSGDLSKFGSNPRICQTQDIISTKLGFYESKDYNICDNLNINYGSKNYQILEVRSRNNFGLPLRLCLQNSVTLKCDLFLALPKNRDFISDYILIPPFKDPHNLAITNQVIEGNTSSNEINYLSVKELDYNSLFNFSKEGQQNLFVYNKAFDKGFIAWCGNWVCPYKHVLYNNWANGWVLPQDTKINNNSILIIFWPNYLSLVGLILFFFINRWVLDRIKKLNKPIVIDKLL